MAKRTSGWWQANTRVEADGVASIAYVFAEVFLIVVKSGHEVDLTNLGPGFTVATLREGSQTYEDMKRVMQFYGYEEGKDYSILEGNYKQGLKSLRSGEANLAFFISGLGNELIDRELRSGKLRLLPIKHREAIMLLNPGYRLYRLPAGLYGNEFPEYDTLATRAVLVCDEDLDERLVYDLTRELFTHRSFLSEGYVFLELEEVSVGDQIYFPTHSGAFRYFQRDSPSTLERNQFWIFLGLSSFGAVISIVGLYLQIRNAFFRGRTAPAAADPA